MNSREIVHRWNHGDLMVGSPAITLESCDSSFGHAPPPLSMTSSNCDIELGVQFSAGGEIDGPTVGGARMMTCRGGEREKDKE